MIALRALVLVLSTFVLLVYHGGPLSGEETESLGSVFRFWASLARELAKEGIPAVASEWATRFYRESCLA